MVKPTSVTPMTLAMFQKLSEDIDNECLTLPDGRRKLLQVLYFTGENYLDFSGWKYQIGRTN